MFCNTKFKEILKLLPQDNFKKYVRQFKADHYKKRFTSHLQLITMLYGQISGFDSLRQIEQGLASNQNHLYHLGIKHKVSRSSLCDANLKNLNRTLSCSCYGHDKVGFAQAKKEYEAFATYT